MAVRHIHDRKGAQVQMQRARQRSNPTLGPHQQRFNQPEGGCFQDAGQRALVARMYNGSPQWPLRATGGDQRIVLFVLARLIHEPSSTSGLMLGAHQCGCNTDFPQIRAASAKGQRRMRSPASTIQSPNRKSCCHNRTVSGFIFTPQCRAVATAEKNSLSNSCCVSPTGLARALRTTITNRSRGLTYRY